MRVALLTLARLLEEGGPALEAQLVESGLPRIIRIRSAQVRGPLTRCLARVNLRHRADFDHPHPNVRCFQCIFNAQVVLREELLTFAGDRPEQETCFSSTAER